MSNTINNSHWFVIINPNSGSKKGAKDWPEINNLLLHNNIEFVHVFTQHRSHAVYLAKEAILNGYRKFIIVGGDGTANEVVNGIFNQTKIPPQEFKIGLIPVGTGNDWGRMYGISGNHEEAVNIIKGEETFLQDAGKIIYFQDDKRIIRYFVNMAGMGFDALVAKKTNIMKEKGKSGAFSYLLNLFLGLFQYRFKVVNVNIDGDNKFNGVIFSIGVGICKYNGGGMMQLPDAIPDDGLLDVILIKKTSRIKVITKIKSLYNGSINKLKEVETYRGKKIEIHSQIKGSIFLEAEGESLGHTPITFEVIPRCIKLVVDKKEFQAE